MGENWWVGFIGPGVALILVGGLLLIAKYEGRDKRKKR